MSKIDAILAAALAVKQLWDSFDRWRRTRREKAVFTDSIHSIAKAGKRIVNKLEGADMGPLPLPPPPKRRK